MYPGGEGLDGVADGRRRDEYVERLIGLEVQAWHGRRL
jgi:hypothetical protein